MTTCLRPEAMRERTGLKRPTVYSLLKKGTFPPPVKLGVRTNVWVESEIEAWLRAKIAGQSDDEIRELVKRLVAERSVS